MITKLATHERTFFATHLPSPEARAFFRRWRRDASTKAGTWEDIRDADFVVNGKKYKGIVLIRKLREHLIRLQGGLCCYCRQTLQGIAWASQIEHILPIQTFRRFTFYYRNLAVACYDCNHEKSSDEWSGWKPRRRRYIPSKRCRKFFHPRYHDYDDHVEYLHIATNGARLSVYFGKTEQGKRLCVDLLHKIAGKQVALSSNRRLEDALTRIRSRVQELDNHAVAGDLANFLNALEDFAAPGI